jgi:hypothetical protein
MTKPAPIAIPAWVPFSLRAAYGRIAGRLGEEAAASQIRSRKRSMTPKELRRDAEAQAEQAELEGSRARV